MDIRRGNVLRFLIHIGVVSEDPCISTSQGFAISCRIGTIDTLNIIFVDDLLPNVSNMIKHEMTATIFVTKDYNYSKELLSYNGCTSLDLMRNNILLIHMTGIICTLSMKINYGMIHIQSSDSEMMNRRNVINACTSKDTLYLSPSGCIRYDDKPNYIFYYRLVEPLETLGVDYIFYIFKTTNELSVDPSSLVYAFRHESTINVIYT